MTDTAADVHVTIAKQRKRAGGITLIVDGKHRRRKKRRLALATMRVSRKNPALKPSPHGMMIGGVRIVA